MQPTAKTRSGWISLTASALFVLLSYSSTAAAQGALQVTALPLPAQLAERDNEYSGMAWHGDWLLLLPQYPRRVCPLPNQSCLFRIARRDIITRITGDATNSLPFQTVSFNDGRLAAHIPGFQGYEAIAFSGNHVFLTIESEQNGIVMSYLVRGSIDEDGRRITLDQQSLTPIAAQSMRSNAGDETLLVTASRVITIYERNVPLLNPLPIAHAFSLPQAAALPALRMPAIPFRITDATEVENRRFWIINYSFPPGALPGEYQADPLTHTIPPASAHARSRVRERLLCLEINGQQLSLCKDTQPLYLALRQDGVSRNWEGIVKMKGYGFLLITDKFPETILGYVPYRDTWHKKDK